MAQTVVDCNLRNGLGWTPVMWAVMRGKVDCVRVSRDAATRLGRKVPRKFMITTGKLLQASVANGRSVMRMHVLSWSAPAGAGGTQQRSQPQGGLQRRRGDAGAATSSKGRLPEAVR